MAQDGPRWLKLGPGWPQDGPKMGPRWPQVSPRSPKMGPGGFKSSVLVEAKRSFSHLGVIFRVLGASWAILGYLGLSLAILGQSWNSLGAILGPFQAFVRGGSGAKIGAPAEAEHSLSHLSLGPSFDTFFETRALPVPMLRQV